jgi:type VI secretion system protein ImpM
MSDAFELLTDDAPTRPLGIAPGWFGKLPALGDFASRRIDEAFTARWDAWLQRCLSASRAALGEQRWLQAYVHAPTWSFVLLPGAIDASAWAGGMTASVDRVGRYFPLTACIQVYEPRTILASVQDGAAWHRQLAGVLASAVSDTTEPEAFERQLAACLFQYTRYGADGGSRDLAAAWAQAYHTGEGHARIAGAIGAALPGMTADLLAQQFNGHSLWWAERGDASTDVRIFRQLPTPEQFVALLGDPQV